MSIYDQHYRCGNCEWEGPESCLEDKLLFVGSQWEPPEYTKRCPSCGYDWELMEEIDKRD